MHAARMGGRDLQAAPPALRQEFSEFRGRPGMAFARGLADSLVQRMRDFRRDGNASTSQAHRQPASNPKKHFIRTGD
jgi:hypothetical protein